MVGWESNVLAMAWIALLCHLVHELIICLSVQHEMTWCKQVSIGQRRRWAKMTTISILYGWLSCDGGRLIMSLVKRHMILRLSRYMCITLFRFIILFRLNVGNIPHNTINPTKHCYGYMSYWSDLVALSFINTSYVCSSSY